MRIEDNHILHVADTDGVSPTSSLYDGSQATSASVNTAAYFVGSNERLSVTLSTSDAATNGSVKLQACNDREGRREVADSKLVNWFDLAAYATDGSLVTSQAVAGASVIVFQIPVCVLRWIRVAWTNTSGTTHLAIRAQFGGIS